MIYSEKTASNRNLELIETPGITRPGGVIEWQIGGDNCDLTADEMKALRRKHGTRNVNYLRASQVKRLMLQGKKCMEIVQELHRDYRQTQVKKDHSALLPYCDRGGAKKRVNSGQRPGK